MKRLIITVSGILLSVIGVIGVILLLSRNWISGGILSGIFLFFAIFFGLGGLKIIHQEEKAIIEWFGKLYGKKGPGLIWICPIIMKIRERVSIWEQSLDLFQENPKIDFTGGGYAQLVKAKVWFKIIDPKKVIYNIGDWRSALKDRMENLFRDFLSNQTVEGVIDQAIVHPWWTLIKEDLKIHKEDPEKEIEKDWGIKVTFITLEDFDWSKEVIETRRDVFIAKREKERQENLALAAPHEAEGNAKRTIGSVVQMMSELTGKDIKTVKDEINTTPELRKELIRFTKEVVTRRMSLDKSALTDIRVDGAQGIEKGLLEIIALWKSGIRSGETSGSTMNKEEEEENKIEKIRQASKRFEEEEFQKEIKEIESRQNKKKGKNK
ncbi:MAG: SPFH domain-containing protein [Patescibacteria group bacterium]|nr:SPFH domain-containing protein [Patescibacteria group bacterium]